MAIYMQIDGIKGGVSAKGHEGWIELESLDSSVNRNIQNPDGCWTG